MVEVIGETIDVVAIYNKHHSMMVPKKFSWHGSEYIISKLGYYHRVRKGRTIIHLFHVTDGNTDFCLSFNSENLIWQLEELST